MAFTIHFGDRSFDEDSFLNQQIDAGIALDVQRFLQSWNAGEDFRFYSSGTTGKPKEFCFTRSQLELSATYTVDALKLQDGREKVLLCLPVKFVAGALMIARAKQLKCDLLIMEPSTDVIARLPLNHGVSFASFISLQLLSPNFDSQKFASIRTVLLGGTGIQKSLEEKLSKFNNGIYHTYGMTETLSHVALRRIGSGKGFSAIAPYQLRINSEDCLCVAGGILEQPLQTNDMARWLDAEHFEILGRKDFVINSGGIKIQPEILESKIEAFFAERKFNNRFAICGLKHEIWGEELVMLCEVDLDADLKIDLIKYLSESSHKFWVPKRFMKVSAIPLNENGKIERSKLNECADNQQL